MWMFCGLKKYFIEKGSLRGAEAGSLSRPAPRFWSGFTNAWGGLPGKGREWLRGKEKENKKQEKGKRDKTKLYKM